MFNNNKRIFLEAFFLALAIFIFGLFLGFLIESRNVSKINQYYADSEASFMDALAFSNLVENNNFSCNSLVSSDVRFADRIYNESRLLDRYEKEQGLTSTIDTLHKKYDSLRTYLWISSSKTLKKCKQNISLIVYLYKFHDATIEKKAEQKSWSSLLLELKRREGNKIILIPIATDSNLSSLDLLIKKYNVTKFPSIIINDNITISNLVNINKIQKIINDSRI